MEQQDRQNNPINNAMAILDFMFPFLSFLGLR